MIRLAKLHDRPHFLRMWSRYLSGQEKDGSHLIENLHNLFIFLDFFESYVLGNVDGHCLLWQIPDREPSGLLMFGAALDPPGWETDLGKTGNLWGVYVDPEFNGQGIALKMVAYGQKLALEAGFDTAETVIRGNNVQPLNLAGETGTEVYAQQHVISLRDNEMLNSEAAKKTLARGVQHG